MGPPMKSSAGFTLSCRLVALLVATLCFPPNARSAAASGAAATRARALAGFEANRGQAPSQVKFIARAPGNATYFFCDTSISVTLQSPRSLPMTRGQQPMASAARRRAIRVTFEGASARARLQPAGELVGCSNYMRGADPRQWITDAEHVSAIRYENIYDGIDIEYYFRNGLIEYDMIVRPGADPGRIRMRYEGADSALYVVGGSTLVVPTAVASLTHTLGSIFQSDRAAESETQPTGCSAGALDGPVNEAAAVRATESVRARWRLVGPDEVAIAVDSYDRSRVLTLDPLVYSTLLGGSVPVSGMIGGGSDVAFGMCVDDAGSAYVTGFATSVDFPTTPGAFSTAHNTTPGDNYDVFVSKLSPDGSTLEFSTFVGGNVDDIGLSIARDPAGNVYVAGRTTSPNFPTTPGAYRTVGGGDDSFLLKLDPTGSSLLYSTIAPGQQDALAVDNAGHAYLACTGQLLKFDPSGAALEFTALLPGYATSLALGAGGEAYVVGYVHDPFTTTPGAFQGSFNGGYWDGFLARVDPTGASLTYSTYLGGSQVDYPYGVALMADGAVAIVGTTNSPDMPTTTGAFASAQHGSWDMFVEVLSLDGAGAADLRYGTYLGGSGNDDARAIAVTPEGQLSVLGVSSSTDYPLVHSCFQGPEGPLNVVLSTLSPLNGGAADLTVSSRIGPGSPSGDFRGYDIAIGPGGDTFLTGPTLSASFPTTPGAFDQTFNGNNDVFIARLSCHPPDTSPPVVQVLAPTLHQIAIEDGNPVSIQWSASDNVAVVGVEVAFSTDGGTNFQNIVALSSNPGSIPWIVSGMPTEEAMIRVRAFDAAGNYGEGFSPLFTISDDHTPPEVQVTRPGPFTFSVMTIGTHATFEWNATDDHGVTETRLYLSRNGGVSYDELLATFSGSPGSFS